MSYIADENSFKQSVKMIILAQCLLEQMDEIKGLPLYRHNIKKKLKSVETDIERLIKNPLKGLDIVDPDLFDLIQSKVELILDLAAIRELVSDAEETE